MGKWKNVRIGEFLTERQGRYKPDDNAIVTYKRLDKIDFSGTIHISEKPSKTDMIIVQPGDLVISGTNVAKGAIAVYQGVEPVTATIHYSSYIFDDSVVDLEYFKYFVKSPAFIETLKKQAKGGIKTEIKSKVFLPLEISLPDLPTQKQIVKRISVNLKRVNELAKEIETQKGYAKQLRRNILQDAIEGKLTADWRKEHPVQKGNPDYDAEALFELIQKEREVYKKWKKLPPILDAEKPFELPTGWKWVRLGEIAEGFMYGTSAKSSPFGTCPVLRMGNIQDGMIDWEKLVYSNNEEEISKYALRKFDLLFNRTNSREIVGKTAVYESDKQAIYAGYLVRFRIILSNPYFINYVLNSPMHREWCNAMKTDALGQSNINAEKLKKFVLTLPPLAEQQKIVDIVSAGLDNIWELKKQISLREEYTNQLMRSILKENFNI
ncbi:restriction endonuclease subunit S [Treponema sp. OMZ 906]|uniref:restriction endonuclease subunit S n=1 Tax=Treponema sp. OMZ 906 TaxID=2563662 RepID=UPI0020A52226|nr:restriction endonuclease subunit S [Treponema sp. OMZ 906]UTC55255.1 restriction endonuclease subunit S [Treponema sp. OMZ 906]